MRIAVHVSCTATFFSIENDSRKSTNVNDNRRDFVIMLLAVCKEVNQRVSPYMQE